MTFYYPASFWKPSPKSPFSSHQLLCCGALLIWLTSWSKLRDARRVTRRWHIVCRYSDLKYTLFWWLWLNELYFIIMTVIISENLDSYLFLLIAVLVFSFDSTLILLLTQSNIGFWTIIFWRQLIQLFTILLVYITPLLFQNKHVINGLRDKFSKIGIW